MEFMQFVIVQRINYEIYVKSREKCLKKNEIYGIIIHIF